HERQQRPPAEAGHDRKHGNDEQDGSQSFFRQYCGDHPNTSDICARRLKRATKPNLIGSAPVTKTMGMVAVAALAVSTLADPPAQTTAPWHHSPGPAPMKSNWTCLAITRAT